MKAEPGFINVTCYGFHLWADDFLQAAKAYLPNARPASFVPHFLCCQSIELSLKAFLSLKGFDRARMKRLGHDLNALLANAIELGLAELTTIDGDDRQTVEKASAWYDTPGGKRFQYVSVGDLVRGFKDAPDLDLLRDLAERLQSKALRDAVLNG